MSEFGEQPTVLIVDDMPINIKILASVLEAECQIIVATHGQQAIKQARQVIPDLILLDVMMPEMSGYEVMQELQADPRTRAIPTIFVTARIEVEDEAKGLEMGAVDFISKPIHAGIVLARVRSHLALKKHQDHLNKLVKERAEEVNKAHLELVSRLAQAGELRDNDTGMHVTRMSHACGLLGKLSGMDDATSSQLHAASSMHDIGKIGIPDGVLLKSGKLNQDEWEVMKNHVNIGGRMLEGHQAPLLKMAWRIAMTHHERWDGTGYPHGLKGLEIPVEGRITAICDVFDALTSDRPYKKAWPIPAAVAELERCSGSQFDPDLLQLFVNHLEGFVDISKSYSG